VDLFAQENEQFRSSEDAFRSEEAAYAPQFVPETALPPEEAASAPLYREPDVQQTFFETAKDVQTQRSAVHSAVAGAIARPRLIRAPEPVQEPAQTQALWPDAEQQTFFQPPQAQEIPDAGEEDAALAENMPLTAFDALETETIEELPEEDEIYTEQ